MCPAPSTFQYSFGSRAAAYNRSLCQGGTMVSRSPWMSSNGIGATRAIAASGLFARDIAVTREGTVDHQRADVGTARGMRRVIDGGGAAQALAENHDTFATRIRARD